MVSEARTGSDSTGAASLAIRVTERSRQVWLVVAACFIAFIAFCAVSAYGLSSFLSGFTVAQGATLEPYTDSTLAVVKHGTVAREQVSGITYPLQEGDSVISDDKNRGIVRLFDESVVQLSFNTQINLDTLRSNEFFERAQDVRITLVRGSIQVKRSVPQDISSDYVVTTDDAEVDLEPNALVRFTLDPDDNKLTEVVVEAGRATFRSKGKVIQLGPQEMAWVNGTDEPQGPLEAETDLIDNGNLRDGPSGSGETVDEGGLGISGWLPIRDEGSIPVPSGSITITKELDHPVAHIHYDASANQATRVGMVQTINKSTEFYSTIELSATIKLVGQQSGGTGGLSDPYPLTVRVVYRDSESNTHEWKRSFYFGNATENISDLTRAQLPVGKWESTGEIRDARVGAAGGADTTLGILNSNLFMVKSPTQNPDVTFINIIEIYGSGSSFESWVTDISLLAR